MGLAVLKALAGVLGLARRELADGTRSFLVRFFGGRLGLGHGSVLVVGHNNSLLHGGLGFRDGSVLDDSSLHRSSVLVYICECVFCFVFRFFFKQTERKKKKKKDFFEKLKKKLTFANAAMVKRRNRANFMMGPAKTEETKKN